jgi:hypothetical protein
MRVKILLAVPDEKSYGTCTLVLDTIRTGYPNAFVTVYINPIGDVHEDLRDDLVHRATLKECRVVQLFGDNSHARWIFNQVIAHSEDLGDQEPLIILDGDILFHSSCEGWQFDNSFLAGYYTPTMFSDFTQCPALARLHTSHLWFTQPRTMVRGIPKVFPAAAAARSDLCPLDLFSPSVNFVNGVPYFWDSCCGLYQMFGGKEFGPEHLACYEHLTSSSAYELKKHFAPNPDATEWLHTEGYKHPELLKGKLWEAINQYYKERAL